MPTRLHLIAVDPAAGEQLEVVNPPGLRIGDPDGLQCAFSQGVVDDRRRDPVLTPVAGCCAPLALSGRYRRTD